MQESSWTHVRLNDRNLQSISCNRISRLLELQPTFDPTEVREELAQIGLFEQSIASGVAASTLSQLESDTSPIKDGFGILTLQ